MGNNINKIKKKIASRRKNLHRQTANKDRIASQFFPRHDEARDEPDFYLYNDTRSNEINWKEKNSLLLRSLIAVVLFFLIAILFQNSSPKFEEARNLVKQAYDLEFNFAAISNWYENQFGRPLALVPRDSQMALGDKTEDAQTVYAVPASGQIRESFEQNGKGVLIETEGGAYVEAVRSGFVISVGQQENIGKTIVIEHNDGTESWYGMLSDVEVKLYDHVEVGNPVGKVTVNEETGKGIFYFSIKQGDDYINPNDVISFE